MNRNATMTKQAKQAKPAEVPAQQPEQQAHEEKTPAIPRITVRESKEGEIYLVASSLKGLGLEGLKEALAVTDNKIGNMNPSTYSFSFAMTKEVVEYLKKLPEGAVQYLPNLNAVIHADKEVDFENNVGWLESTGNDGGVNATIRYSYDTLASGKAKEISETLKNAGMKFDRNLLVWSGPVTTDNLLALNDLDGHGIDWAQNFQDMTADVGAPEQPAEAKQEKFAEPKAPDKPFEP